MIQIKGHIQTFKREEFNGSCINEFVYDFSSKDLRRGVRKIKGVSRAVLNDEIFIPYGSNGFYYKISNDIGIKVFYGLAKNTNNESRVEQEWHRCNKFYSKGFSVKPIRIDKVHLNVILNNKKIKVDTQGIVTERVQLTDAMWDFSIGRLYNFDCLDKYEHPLHTSYEFLEFRKKIEENIEKNILPKVGTKLGDIVYCTNKKKWFIVDCGGKI